MSPKLQANPVEVLSFKSPSSPSTSSLSREIQLPTDICFGSGDYASGIAFEDSVTNNAKGSCGGFLACLMTNYAVSHAAQTPKTKHQTDVRSAHIQFYRPVFPAKDSCVHLQLREVSIGKSWSTLRVELTQGSNGKVAASADVLISNLSIPGKTLPTNWKLSPPAQRVDLSRLETSDDSEWACYHTAFRPDGFRRGMSYVKYYIPRTVPSPVKFVEQWVTPGWDCTPSGSRDAATKEATWTNDLIQFAADMSLPVQENLWPPPGVETSVGSIVAHLAFAARQEEARKKGHANWRDLDNDGSLPDAGRWLFKNAMINATLSMSTEIKKRLPEGGVRWLYMRTEAKKLEGGRMDMEVLLFDEAMDLVAISHQVAWIITGTEKTEKASNL